MRFSMRILVAEDDQVSLAILEHALAKWGYEVECVNNGVAALNALVRVDAPRLAILDWMMPEMNGIDVCRAIRNSQTIEQGYTYMILLTIRSSLFDMVDGLSAGADDYIIKPFIPHDLKVRLDSGKRIVELQGKLVETRRVLDLQQQDLITRTWNRETILAHLHAELNRAKRKGRSLSIAIVKICNYGELLASLGKAGLDDFMCSSVSKLRDTIRSYDYIGRFNEDEFMILFPETVKDEMPTITARLMNVINQARYSSGSETMTLSTAIGVVTCMGYTDEEFLIATAIDTLRQAISEGSKKTLFSFV